MGKGEQALTSILKDARDEEWTAKYTNTMPYADWYETLNADYINFWARSVVGGVFMKSSDHYLRNKRK